MVQEKNLIMEGMKKMLNQIVLVGRIKEIKEEKENVIVKLSVNNSFKNMHGEYEENLIDCKLYKGIAEKTKEYCKTGDVIGVKGRLQKLENDKELTVIAERVSFLSARKEED